MVLDRHTRRLFAFLETILADGAYGGDKLGRAMDAASWTIEVVKRPAGQKGFEALPKRWVVERSRRDGAKRAAWLNRNRRLAKDFERTIQSATAWLYMASVQLLTRRLAAR